MFKRNGVPVRVSAIVPEIMERDESEIALVKLTCEINPFTPELASELHDFVRATLYTMSGAEVNSLLSGATFAISVGAQAIAVRMAPDTKKPSFTIDEAKITGIHAKRLKKSSAWTLAFSITCAPASEHQIAQIMECYTRTKYLTFAPAEPGLFDEAPTTSRGLTSAETEQQDEAEADDSCDAASLN